MDLIKEEIKKIQTDLGNLRDDNFDYLNDKIFKSVAKIKETRMNLSKNLSPEQLLICDREVMEPVKLILKKFDTIIQEKKAEQQKIAAELKEFDNKKKITKYIR